MQGVLALPRLTRSGPSLLSRLCMACLPGQVYTVVSGLMRLHCALTFN